MFISDAFAQTADAATKINSPWMSILPLVIIFILFYLLIIRPQSKRIKEHQGMLQTLKAGDKVVTGGGIFATVIKVTDHDATLEVAPGVQIKAQKHTITALQDAAIPANDVVKK